MTSRNRQVVLFAFPESEAVAGAFADALHVESRTVELHRFPDGESRIRLPDFRTDTAVIYRSLNRPNHKLVELMLCARHLRADGARTIVLVAPYLCYMRQDMAFAPGEIVSQRWIGAWLASLFDGLITVDPHLHRVARLQQVLPDTCCEVVSAAPLAGRLARATFADPVLVGPDQESRQWLEQAANGDPTLDCLVATKKRASDRKVRLKLPDFQFRERDVIVIDDIASTGHTLAECARIARQRGARDVKAIVTHALFPPADGLPDGCQALSDIWSTDSIPHPSNRIRLAEPIARACARVLMRLERKNDPVATQA